MEQKAVKFSPRRVLLVGDLVVDIHHYGTNSRKSSEADILVGSHQKSVISWGGAGLVARNILALGGLVTFVSVLGDDYEKKAESFSHKNLKIRFFVEKGRKTMVKERFLIDSKKVLRWNKGDSGPISPKMEKAILDFVKRSLKSFDVLLISDYRHGVMIKSLAESLVKEGRKQNKPVYVDSQVVKGGKGNHNWYRGATLVCLNEREAESVDPGFSPRTIENSLKRISRIFGISNVVVKLGEKGSASLIGNNYIFTPGHKVKALDAVGAGDAFFAALALLPGNFSPEDLELVNKWAALSTTIRGTEPPTLPMLLALKKRDQK